MGLVVKAELSPKVKAPLFNLEETMICGQTFCWFPEGGKWVNVSRRGVLKVWQHGEHLKYECSDGLPRPLEQIFRFKDDLEEIYSEISKDYVIRRIIERHRGLRVINDELWPCLVSYICSQQLRIPRVRRLMDILARRYGDKISYRGMIYNVLPTPKQLDEVSLSKLKEVGLGYRARYIKKTTNQILKGEVDIKGLYKLPYSEVKRELMKLHGVGEKVADCVALFSMGHLEAFPLDVWTFRAIAKFYPHLLETGGYGVVSRSCRRYFGRYAGYAQEYLFRYIRK